MTRSVVLALVIAAGAFAWILSGQLDRRERPAQADDKAAALAEAPPPSVRVRTIVAERRPRRIVVNGRTEASRTVQLRAETEGPVAAVPVAEGARVRQGEALVRIALQDRRARLDWALAQERQREMEYQAARELESKGFRASTKLAEAQALLDAARAEVERYRVDLTHTEINAPFEGVLERRDVEVGAFLKVGDPVATVVDLDPILVVAAVSERAVGRVAPGITASVTLVDGRTAAGQVRFVGTVADPETRTYRVEVAVANPDRAIPDGMTAEVALPLPDTRAHFVSPAVLSLAEDGTLGVKTVEPDDTVAFRPVVLLEDTGKGVWLGGLPERVRLITVGQDYVKAGQKVRPVPEDAAS